MRSRLQRLARRLLAGIGVVVIVLALVLGVFRLLIAQIPEYQDELKVWVASELGLDFDFQQLDARLGLSGPELSLLEARIGRRDGGGRVLQAARAAIAIDPWQLLFEGQISVARLRLDGVRLDIERSADGALIVGGYRTAPGSDFDWTGLVPEDVEIEVRDSQVVYIDLQQRHSWLFVDVDLSLDREPERLRLTAQARPPAELAERFDFTLEAGLDADSGAVIGWSLSGEVGRLQLEPLTAFVPIESLRQIGGVGDAEFTLQLADDRVQRSSARLALEDFSLDARSEDADAIYDRLEFSADWTQQADRSWRLGLDDIRVSRAGASWQGGGEAEVALERSQGEADRVRLKSDFIRLDDLEPFVLAFPETQLGSYWEQFRPRGDISDFDLSLQRAGDAWDYQLAAAFDELGFERSGRVPGFTGLTGDVDAGTRSGTIQFDSAAISLDWPGLFPQTLNADGLSGAVVWRQGRDVVRVVSNDLELRVLDQPLRSSFELSLSPDGSSPRLDLESRMPAVDLVAAKSYLPNPILPPSVAQWVEQAVQGGRGHDIELSFYGPLDAFPFDQGEGQFRVAAQIEDAVLEFMQDWPPAEDLDGNIEFLNASFSARGEGRILGNHSDNIAVGIADMRSALLTYSGDTEGPLTDVLSFLRQAPLVAQHLGSRFDRLQVRGGRGLVWVDLALPLLDRAAFELDAALAIVDGGLAIDGFGPEATEVNGRLLVSGTSISGEAIDAVFLGGPVFAAVGPAARPGYRTSLRVQGETTAEAVLDSFSLPFEDLFAGQTLWRGELLLPAPDDPATDSMRLEVESNLAGIALRFPAPLAKAPSEPTNLQLSFIFPGAENLSVNGNLGATRRFALDYEIDPTGFRFTHGSVQFGGEAPILPVREGITVNGRLPMLDLNDWLALAKTSSIERARPLFLGASLDLSEFNAYGQRLGSTRLNVGRAGREWQIDIDSEAIAGSIQIPMDLSSRPEITADMQRVYLAGGERAAAERIAAARVELGQSDPRKLPGFEIHADEFGFGTRQLGRIEARVVPDPLGLRLASFRSETESFSAEGSGSWLYSADTSTTRIAATVSSRDVAASLDELGLAPVIEGETADLTASLHWSGPPWGRWLDHVNGDLGLSVATGSLVDVDPGAGRVLGLMSFAALPRRLAFDFRDVFDAGFAFDEITADFSIIDGNAYTNNLKMGGPSAEIGLIGRTGLRDRDYQQQAVVTSEPGNALPTLGALVGGAGVGAALWIFTRLFKEPLSGIGRASYCITGAWDAPEIERISNDEADRAEQCVALPKSMLEVRDE